MPGSPMWYWLRTSLTVATLDRVLQVRSQNLITDKHFPKEVLIGLNKRNPQASLPRTTSYFLSGGSFTSSWSPCPQLPPREPWH